MFDKLFSAAFNFIERHKRATVITLLLISILALIRIISVEFKNDIALMLPDNTEVQRNMHFFRNSNVSDKVVISFSLTSDEHTLAEAIEYIDRFTNSLESPLITGIESRLTENSPLDDIQSIMAYSPQLITEEQLEQLKAKLTDEGVKKALRRNYRMLIAPGSSFSSSFIRSDPFNLNSEILNSLQQLSNSMGYKIVPKSGHLVSEDMKHVMVVLQTPIAITDGSGSKRLMKFLNNKLSDIPSYMKADIISGHSHSISNEKVIKGDISFTLTISGIAFLLLFVIVLKKDIRYLLLLFLPVFSAFLSMALASLIMPNLSYFIIGMGGVITGISIDYGIHVYMAVNSNNDVSCVKDIAKPVTVGALTTVGAFLAFFFSKVPGYHQLALFAICSIVLSLILSLLLLPHFLNRKESIKVVTPEWFRFSLIPKGKGASYSLIVIWLGIMVFMGVFAFQQKIDNDVTQFDGSEKEVFQREKEFQKAWGGSNRPAILVTSSTDQEKLFEHNEAIYEAVIKDVDKSKFSSMVSFWPSKKSRAKNAGNWNKFWSENKQKLKNKMAKYSAQYGFADNAFAPFFNTLDKKVEVIDLPVHIPLFKSLSKQFLYKRDGKYTMLSYFPDEKEYIDKVNKICKNHADTFIVSRKEFSNILSRAVSTEIVTMAGIAAILIPLLALMLLRSIYYTFLAMLPVVSSVIIVGGVLSIMGTPLSAPVIIAGLILVGLCIDYGIFMVFQSVYKMKMGTVFAVTLSALTTVIGGGAVIFARHPMLYNIGLTLIVGMGTGYIVSVLIIPAMINLTPTLSKPKNPMKIVGMLLFCSLIFNGCRSIPFKETELVPLKVEDPAAVPEKYGELIPQQFANISSIIFHYRWNTFSSLGVCKVDRETEELTLVGMNQVGIKLFEVSGSPDGIKCKYAIEEFKKFDKFAETVVNDSRAIYFNSIPKPVAKVDVGKYKIHFTEPFAKGEMHYYFGGKDLYLLEKIYVEDGDEVWKVSFYEYKLFDGKLFPKGIVLDNYKYGYYLVLKLREVE